MTSGKASARLPSSCLASAAARPGASSDIPRARGNVLPLREHAPPLVPSDSSAPACPLLPSPRSSHSPRLRTPEERGVPGPRDR